MSVAENDKPTTPAGSTGESKAGGASTLVGRNKWDFATAVIVLAFLAGMTIFLVRHYTEATEAGSILGILIPAVGAIFGVTIAYQAGNTTGQATGQETAKQDIKNNLGPRVRELNLAAEEVMTTVEREGESLPGTRSVTVQQSAEFDAETLDTLRERAAEVRGYIAAL